MSRRKRLIAVVGASGFVGHHVVTALMCHDVDVVATATRSDHLADIAGLARVETLNVHEHPGEAFDRLGRPDAVIHLAWAGLPNYRSLHHIETELPAQFRFLCGLIRQGLTQLTVIGTCFEYGMQSGSLAEHLQCLPANPYGYAKHALHQQLGFFKDQHPFALQWLRLFYMFGPGQSTASLYRQLQAAIDGGLDSFDMSGGEQLRDYLAVGDVARHIVQLALGAGDCGVVNICAGRPVSVRAVVEGWIREREATLKLNLGVYPYPDYEPMAFWGNDSKLRLLSKTK